MCNVPTRTRALFRLKVIASVCAVLARQRNNHKSSEFRSQKHGSVAETERKSRKYKICVQKHTTRKKSIKIMILSFRARTREAKVASYSLRNIKWFAWWLNPLLLFSSFDLYSIHRLCIILQRRGNLSSSRGNFSCTTRTLLRTIDHDCMHAAVFNSFLSFLVVVSGDNCGLRTESQISHPLQGFERSTPQRRWKFASRVVECSSPWITPGSLGQLIFRFIYYLHKRRQQQQRGEKVHRHRPIESRNCWAKEMALFFLFDLFCLIENAPRPTVSKYQFAQNA